MKNLMLLLCVTLMVILCVACRDKEVYSDSSDISSANNVTSISTPSQTGGVEQEVPSNSSFFGSTVSDTVSTIVDEVVINEPTSSVIMAIDLETGEEVQVTVTSKPSSTADSSSGEIAPSSSEQQSSSIGEENTSEQSSSGKPVDPNRDTMEGFTPWQ